ncbi:hypothetical protein Tsp_04593 [Trichinella spiralis]|uniref:hypothetical protein n=1 Tax=Trichinella spiralis TaxID=6334 RepID=UPI0001EFD3A9|nr:hypothetical protein Tsp_04593 [Trichinella spiralis]
MCSGASSFYRTNFLFFEQEYTGLKFLLERATNNHCIYAHHERLEREHQHNQMSNILHETELADSEITGTAAATVTTRREGGEDLAQLLRPFKELLTSNTPAAAKRAPLQQQRRRQKRESRRCWTCG